MTLFKIGIDFGGEFLRIFNDEKLIYKEPSLVAVKKKGKMYYSICTGEKAKILKKENSKEYLVFSPIYEGKIQSVEYASLILKQALVKISHLLPKGTPDALISVPSSLDIDEKQLYVRVCKMVGINKINLVSSPLCALLGTKAYLPEDEVLIADLGATKCDFQIMKNFQIQKNATLALGGNSIKTAISNMLLNEKKFLLEDEKIYQTEIELASLFENDKRTFYVDGFDTLNHTNSQILLTSKDLFPIIHGLFDEVCLVIQTLLKDYSPQNTNSPSLLICGGLGRVSGLSQYLTKKFPKTKIYIETENDNVLETAFERLLI